MTPAELIRLVNTTDVICPRCGHTLTVPLEPGIVRLNARGDVQVRFTPQILEHECFERKS